MEKAKVLNIFFVSVFNSQSSLQESHALETREEIEEGSLPLLEEVQVRERLNWTCTSLWYLMGCTHKCWELLEFRYETSLSYRRMIMVDYLYFLLRNNYYELSLLTEENKCHSCFQGGSGELQVGQLHFSLWEGDEANPHGNHFQTHAGQDGDLK